MLSTAFRRGDIRRRTGCANLTLPIGKYLVFLLFMVALIAALGLYWQNSRLEREPEPELVIGEGVVPDIRERKQTKVQGNHVRPLVKEGDEKMDLEEIFAICGVSFPLWSEECLSVLDNAYIDQEVHRSLLRLPDEPTWRDVFADTGHSHDLALHAMANPHCNVVAGNMVLDLAGECYPGDLVKIGTLKMECSQSLRRDLSLGVDENGMLIEATRGGFASLTERDLANFSLIDDQDRAKAMRRTKIGRFLETGWLRNRCEKVSDLVFSTVDGIHVDESIA